MTVKEKNTRNARLAAALKENLKRRKAKRGASESGPASDAQGGEPSAAMAHNLGTAPQAGLESMPQAGPKSAAKRQ